MDDGLNYFSRVEDLNDSAVVTPATNKYPCVGVGGAHNGISLVDVKYYSEQNIPTEYILKNNYKFTDKDYKDYVKMLKRDAKLKWQLAQIEANGELPKKEDLS